jgi:hypothetical protein
MKKHTTNCIRCWKEILVSFSSPVKQINCLELECCKPKPKNQKEEIKDEKMRYLHKSIYR